MGERKDRVLSTTSGNRHLNAATLLIMLTVCCFVVSPCFVTGWSVDYLLPWLEKQPRPQLTLWLLLIAVQGGIWCVGWYLLWIWWRQLWKKLSGVTVLLMVGHVVLPLVLLCAPILATARLARGANGLPSQLDLGYVKHLESFGKVGFLAAAFAVAGVLMTGLLLEKLAQKEDDLKDKVAEFLDLQRLLTNFLLIAGLVLGFGTVATAALRNLVNAEKIENCYFAKEYIIVYGGIYSSLLAIAWGSVRARFFRFGSCIKDAIVDLPPTSAAELKDWTGERDSVDGLLQLRFTGVASLGPVLSVLAPILMSWISTLIGS